MRFKKKMRNYMFVPVFLLFTVVVMPSENTPIQIPQLAENQIFINYNNLKEVVNVTSSLEDTLMNWKIDNKLADETVVNFYNGGHSRWVYFLNDTALTFYDSPYTPELIGLRKEMDTLKNQFYMAMLVLLIIGVIFALSHELGKKHE